ncbi:MAG: hypothetical protein AAF485_05090 [Chloroflexota bacterium]
MDLLAFSRRQSSEPTEASPSTARVPAPSPDVAVGPASPKTTMAESPIATNGGDDTSSSDMAIGSRVENSLSGHSETYKLARPINLIGDAEEYLTEIPFVEYQTYTLDGTDVYQAVKTGEMWTLYDVNKSDSWRANNWSKSLVGYIEGYFLWPDTELMWGRFTVGLKEEIQWIDGPEPADLFLEDFTPCRVAINRVEMN